MQIRRLHTPAIKFLGKRDHTRKLEVVVKSVAPVVPKVEYKSSPNAISFEQLPGKAWHGRPKLSPKEIELIMSGGAW